MTATEMKRRIQIAIEEAEAMDFPFTKQVLTQLLRAFELELEQQQKAEISLCK